MSCGNKIGDFDCCSIVQGDCLVLMQRLNRGSFDAVVTDPPYGIGVDGVMAKQSGQQYGVAAAPKRKYAATNWDSAPCPHEAIEHMMRISEWQVIFGGNYFTLPPSSCWLVWDKQNGSNDFADCELAWTNMDKAVRKIEWLWNGMIRKGHEERFHPTQKPLGVMQWCIQQIGDPRNVLDPFAGSGTTLVAAKKLGIHYLGFEMNAEYCAIAQRRLDEVDAQPTLFAPRPEQLTL